MALTDVAIRALQPRDRVYKCADARGLYLEVHPSGSKLWRYKYRHLGKDKRIALGRYPDVGLGDARRKCDEARLKVADGIDPGAERRRSKLVARYQAAWSFHRRPTAGRTSSSTNSLRPTALITAMPTMR
jgi:hypothetical protein